MQLWRKDLTVLTYVFEGEVERKEGLQVVVLRRLYVRLCEQVFVLVLLKMSLHILTMEQKLKVGNEGDVSKVNI